LRADSTTDDLPFRAPPPGTGAIHHARYQMRARRLPDQGGIIIVPTTTSSTRTTVLPDAMKPRCRQITQ
jgi:hypothetical protein